jgi:hypothetical protein
LQDFNRSSCLSDPKILLSIAQNELTIQNAHDFNRSIVQAASQNSASPTSINTLDSARHITTPITQQPANQFRDFFRLAFSPQWYLR